MDKLIVKGLINIEGMKFHDIEGGFGKDKKAMLVKEIANIHGREAKKVNELINNNRKRFNDNVDVIDLKGADSAVLLKDSGIYTQNAINASSNIYLLSERGYAKLLKILEDDVAWEQYEKLVDGYFNMRSEIPKMSKELQAIFMLDGKTEKMDQRITKIENTMTIETGKQKVLCDLVNKKVVAILGGKDTPAYKELNKKAFRQCWNDFKKILDVASYKDTAIKDFELAKKTIVDWKPNRELELMIKGCNSMR